MKREAGYYWIKYHNDWLIAEYNPEVDYWFFVGDGDNCWMESELEKIDENQILNPNDQV
jgi:hypothetical protein